MLDTGVLIAIAVVMLYTILGPLVLFGVYIIFDSLDKADKSGINLQKQRIDKIDPALWTSESVDIYMEQF